EFVNHQNSQFVRQVEPLPGHRRNGEFERVPVHLLWAIAQELTDPLLIPRQCAAQWILEEAMQSEAHASQADRLAIEIGSLGEGLEAKLPHAESCESIIARRRAFESVERRGIRTPTARRWNCNGAAVGDALGW